MITNSFKPNPGQLRAQRALYSTATNVLLTSGSGSGKSRLILEYLHDLCVAIPGSQHLVLRRTRASCKATLWNQVWAEVLASKPGLKDTLTVNREELTATYSNGSVIKFGGLEQGEARDKLLGGTYLTAFLNEATQFDYQDWTDISTRVRQRATFVGIDGEERVAINKLIADCNPTKESHFLCRLFRDRVNPTTRIQLDNRATHAWVKLHPSDNIENLGADYIRTLEGFDPAARKRFLDGDWGSDVADALFPERWVHDNRVDGLPDGPERQQAIDEWRARLVRIIVAVDPAVTANDKSDETGIIVAGIDHEGHGYILEDLSCKRLPLVWGKAVLDAYHRWQADRISVEGNHGHELLRTVLESIDPLANIHLLNAKTSKVSRAEPVANIYSKGLIHHVGEFPLLEDQMFALESTYKKGQRGTSPDRVDALVWSVIDLMVGEANLRTGGGGSSRVAGLW
ncbi:phage DNA Packaging protein [Novosphingobium sp. Rr 2-17]|uniref:phage terminase large subunit n=1 Tax=Novosphingobium sp. Rr 2-17 TaxID=555793 RepID=UPI000269888D|nr:phage terminase large subunit [Novosphingobium sp. Rr 2-17]EIZ79222.1 phage DNA Packaging protein [Novosphingobium sp. Rr 2-17]